MYITHQLKQNQRDQKGLGEDQLPDSRGMGGGTAPAPLDAMRCARRRACAACTATAPTPSRPRWRRSHRRARRPHAMPRAASLPRALALLVLSAHGGLEDGE
jgi:hypothetical protein